MNDELATDTLVAYEVAVNLPRDLSELIDALEDGNDLDSIAKAVETLRCRRNLVELCGLDDSDCIPMKISSLAELRIARDVINTRVYWECISKLMSDPPQLSQWGVIPYLDGAVAYGDTYTTKAMVSELKTQSARMTLLPAVRLEALKTLPAEALMDIGGKLDLATIQRTVEEVVAITGTETFEPPTDFMDRHDSPEEVEIRVRDGLQALARDLMIDFASEASRPNPLRTSTSYLLAYCKVGQAMSSANDLDIS